MQPTIPSQPSPGFRPRLLALSVAACFSMPAAMANPTGGTVVSGSATFATSGNALTINNSANAIINWQSFSISAGEITKFIQSSSASAVLNRVIGSGGVIPQSIINGILSSNGQVFLLNPSGVVIGANAFIDVAGLVTSSLNMSNEDFLAGRMRFTDVPGAGRVKNEGTIETPSGGRVYLIAPDVENSGVIRSPDGQIVLAAGKSVELAAENTPFVTVKITADSEQALNVGSMVARGGSINMHGALVKQSGLVEAGSAVVGANGEIRFVASKDLTLTAGSKTTASGAAGGKLLLQAQTGSNRIEGTVEAKGASGAGGTVQALGVRVGVLGNGIIDASGETGGGTVQVGGDYKGRNADVQNAQSTEIGSDGVIRADARNTGDGGRVIVWADGDSRVAGTISVRGGANGGDGGFVETSGKQTLDISGARISMGAPRGKGGLWLLDPADYDLDAPAASSINAAMYGGGSTLIEAAENINFLTNLDIAEQGSGTFSAYAGNDINMGVYRVTTNGQSVVMEANSSLIYGVTPSGTGSITHSVGGGTFRTRGGSVSLSGVDVSVGSIDTMGGGSGIPGGSVNIAAYGGGIAVNGFIQTHGTDAQSNNYPYSPGQDGGKGGDITLTAGDSASSITVYGGLFASGGNGGNGTNAYAYYGSTAGGNGGNGGDISIGAAGSLNIQGTVVSRGGAGGQGGHGYDTYYGGGSSGGNGGRGGNFSIFDDKSSLTQITLNHSLYVSGGAGGWGGDLGGQGGRGGDGGLVDITGGSVQTQSVFSAGGDGGQGGAGGTSNFSAGHGGNAGHGGSIWMKSTSSLAVAGNISAHGGKGGNGGTSQGYADGGEGGSGGNVQTQYDYDNDVYLGIRLEAYDSVSVNNINANGGNGGDGVYYYPNMLAGVGGSIAIYGGEVSTGSLQARSGTSQFIGQASAGGSIYVQGSSVEIGGDISTRGGSTYYYGNHVRLEATSGALSTRGIDTSAINSRMYGGDVSLSAYGGIYVVGSIDTRGANGMDGGPYSQHLFTGTRGGDIRLTRTGDFALSSGHAVEVTGNLLTYGGNGLDGAGYYGYGLGGQGGNVTISGPSDNELYGSVRVGGDYLDTRGGKSANQFNSEAGAAGGNAGNIIISGTGNVEVLAGIQATGGGGGRGGNSDGYLAGGDGGKGGDGGDVTLTGATVSFNAIHADGGAGGAGGAGTLDYAGGAGGMGGMGGQVYLSSLGGGIMEVGSVLAAGGAGGAGGTNIDGGPAGLSGTGGSFQWMYLHSNGGINLNGAIRVRDGLNGEGIAVEPSGGFSLTASGEIAQGSHPIATNFVDITQRGSSGNVTLNHSGNDIRQIYADGGEGAPIQGSFSFTTSNENPNVLGIHARDAVFLKNSLAGAGFNLNEVVSQTSGVTVVSDAIAHISETSVHAEDPVNGYFQYYTLSNLPMTITSDFFTDVHTPRVILGSESTTANITLSGIGVTPTTPNEIRTISTRTSGAVSVGTIYMHSASPTLPATLDLQGGSISQTGYLDVDHLAAHASSGSVTLTYAGNRISAIGSGSAAGNFSVSSAFALNPSANNIQAGGDINLTNSIANAGNAWNLGNIMSSGGSVNVMADSLGVAQGASAMNVHAANAFSWRTANNATMGVNQGFFDSIHAPTIKLGGSGQTAPIVLTGAVNLGSTDTLSLYSTGDVYQADGATLTAKNFSAHGANVLFPLVNNVQNFHGRAAAGELNFVNGDSLKLTAIDPAIVIPGATATDYVSILADGNLSSDIVGSYAIRAPEVGVLASGTIGSATTPLQIQTDFLGSVSGTSAYLTTNQFDPAMVTLGHFVNDDVGHIVLNAYGGATTTTLVDNPGGNIEIKTFSPLNVLAGMNAGGNILLATSGSGNNDIQLNGTFTYGGTSFSVTPGAGGLAVQGTGYKVVALAPTTTVTGAQQVQNLVRTDSSFKQALDITTTETSKTTEATTSVTALKDDPPTAEEKKKEEEKKGTKVGVAVCK